ncbi:DUF4352 domain-containing protein [Enterococcus asini]|uniref:DUF4352 domain-containing protein n=1 Tax=Enterococcus asini TaxID=57732 RepID=A0AAW8TX82_9ENTE|nr:DUF4352 domain-containing protein [Enterococcus asini]MDT2809154.1 DUF4352 domain-containing protein [Enterococcus asini]
MKKVLGTVFVCVSLLLAGCGSSTESYGGVEMENEKYDKLEAVFEKMGDVAKTLDTFDYTAEKENLKITSNLTDIEESYQDLNPKDENKLFNLLLSSSNVFSVNQTVNNATSYQRDFSQAERTAQYDDIKESILEYALELLGSKKDAEKVQKQFFKDINLTTGYYEDYSQVNTYSSSAEETTTSSSTQDSTTPLTYSIGDSVDFTSDDGDRVTVTIDGVSKYAGDDWTKPTGPFFAKVDFTVKNNGTAPFDASSHQFEFYDSGDIKSELNSKDFFGETIQAGKSAKGSAYFDVITDGDTFEVFYGDTSWTGNYQ